VSAEVVRAATPLDRDAVPSTFPPEVNFTNSPFGIAPNDEVTVAVKVTG
jgi:hypothetical protein